jgi:hypothetical protein
MLWVMKKSDFHKRLIQNTRKFRLKAGFEDMKEFAEYLGIPYAAYAKYETRTPLPHHLIPKYCRLTQIPIKTLFEVEPARSKPKLHPVQGFLISAK